MGRKAGLSVKWVTGIKKMWWSNSSSSSNKSIVSILEWLHYMLSYLTTSNISYYKFFICLLLTGIYIYMLERICQLLICLHHLCHLLSWVLKCCCKTSIIAFFCWKVVCCNDIMVTDCIFRDQWHCFIIYFIWIPQNKAKDWWRMPITEIKSGSIV